MLFSWNTRPIIGHGHRDTIFCSPEGHDDVVAGRGVDQRILDQIGYRLGEQFCIAKDTEGWLYVGRQDMVRILRNWKICLENSIQYLAEINLGKALTSGPCFKRTYAH